MMEKFSYMNEFGKNVLKENYEPFTTHICDIEIPQGFYHLKPKKMEIRRSILPDAAFIVIRDGEVEIVDQMEIWLVIEELCKDFAKAFGLRGMQINWNNEPRIPNLE